MTIPKFDETFIPILKVLNNENDIIHHSALRQKVIDKFYNNLSEEDKAKVTPKQKDNLLEDRIGWGFYYLKMGKFVEQPKRGYFQITEKGRNLLKEKRVFLLKDLKQDEDFIKYKKDKEKYKKAKDENLNLENYSPQELIETGIEDLTSSLKVELLERLKNSDPYYFEKIILKLFKKMGYGDYEETPKSGDGGIDGILNQDTLGFEKIYTQAKRYNSNKVTEREIRNFKGAMDGKVTKGIFVTTSDFDANARQSAKDSNNQIMLINGEELVEFMIEHNIGVQEKSSYQIKSIDEDFFVD